MKVSYKCLIIGSILLPLKCVIRASFVWKNNSSSLH